MIVHLEFLSTWNDIVLSYIKAELFNNELIIKNKPRQLVSFDWAMKRLLRQKANYVVLEGFLSELLREDISIVSFEDSETNKLDEADKYNRVDLLVKDSKEHLMLVEVQYDSDGLFSTYALRNLKINNRLPQCRRPLR